LRIICHHELQTSALLLGRSQGGRRYAAGEQLHTTPQTLSGQINQLEEWLGHELFRKRGRELELTNEGRIALVRRANLCAER
jgi:hypothetical protein